MGPDGLNLEVSVAVDLEPETAFRRFTTGMRQWWPAEYTWSGAALVDISLDPTPGGAGTETGPHGFRCDFARVTVAEAGRRLVFSWQISPHRVPLPDPSNAGEVEVRFGAGAEGGTWVTLRHSGFEKYGEDGGTYRDAMASEQGWPLLMRLFADL